MGLRIVVGADIAGYDYKEQLKKDLEADDRVEVEVSGERTAYAVGRDCTTGNPSLLAGPVRLP